MSVENEERTRIEWLDAELYCPFQRKLYFARRINRSRRNFLDEQALLYEHAALVGTRAFLKMVDLPCNIEQRPNAEFMSPTSGLLPFIKVDNKTLVAGFSEIVELVAQKARL